MILNLSFLLKVSCSFLTALAYLIQPRRYSTSYVNCLTSQKVFKNELTEEKDDSMILVLDNGEKYQVEIEEWTATGVNNEA